jgi:NADH:ubiquinone oxidoreductase subunit K
MYFGDINLYIIFFILILASITINVSSALHLLLTAEILWITLYILVLSVGILYDNINFLSLTFFFLVLSAVEFGVGLVIMLVQNVFLRSISLGDSYRNINKYSSRFLTKIKSTKSPWL